MQGRVILLNRASGLGRAGDVYIRSGVWEGQEENFGGSYNVVRERSGFGRVRRVEGSNAKDLERSVGNASKVVVCRGQRSELSMESEYNVRPVDSGKRYLLEREVDLIVVVAMLGEMESGPASGRGVV